MNDGLGKVRSTEHDLNHDLGLGFFSIFFFFLRVGKLDEKLLFPSGSRGGLKSLFEDELGMVTCILDGDTVVHRIAIDLCRLGGSRLT